MDTERLARVLGRPVEPGTPPLTLYYPRTLLVREVAKGLGGAAACAARLWLQPAPALAWPLGGVIALALVYAAMQAWRGSVTWRLETDRVTRCLAGRCRTLHWDGLTGLRLHFYRFGRRAEHGQLVLHLEGRGVRLRADSALHGFPALLQSAFDAARRRDVAFNATISTCTLSRTG